MPRQIYSNVWDCYIKIGGGGQCKLCGKEIKSCGNTTNLRNHLIRKHHIVKKSGKSDMKKSDLSNATMSKEVHKVDSLERENVTKEDSESFEMSQTDRRSPTPTPSNSSTCSTLSQKRIDHVFSEIRSVQDGGEKYSQITNEILFMIVKDNLPLNTSEKAGFQHFMKKVLPHFKIPGRTAITHLLDTKFDVLHNIIKDHLYNVKCLSVTADVWTDNLNTQSFLGATGHYIHNGKFVNIFLCLEELDEKHTADFLKEKLLENFRKWNIDILKIKALVTDNGANITKACEQIVQKSKHLPCFSHTLNLVAIKIVEEENVNLLIGSVKNIVRFFKHSVVAADELRKLSTLKLISSVPTRWHSTYHMLERFLRLRTEIGIVLLKFPKGPTMLTGFELQEIDEIIQLLRPLEMVSTEMSGDHYVTCSKVIPIVNILQQQVIDLNLQTERAESLKTSLLEELNKRFGKVEEVGVLAIATVLDPRFKRLHFKNPLALSNAISKIKQFLENRKDSIWKYHHQLVSTSSYVQQSDPENSELKHYLSQKVVDIHEDPIVFWKNHKLIYPTLSCLAYEYLCIVATSVPSERLFSKAGVIMESHRNRLLGTRLSKILFLNYLPEEDWHL
ncbi:hypothetical protein ABEB36_015316 [Hypothenemus hampei]|uniref:BED-type domain-containing protein n=1 Tax=Hypothenemus hampei TaxID=57062 RepID=A0ABD1E4F3_HYPHA